MILDELHKVLIKNHNEISSWFFESTKNQKFPIYSSFDFRNSGFKIAPVDANFFPSGFNNICRQDRDFSKETMRKYFKEHYPKITAVNLIVENHTKNTYYWDNVDILQEIFSFSLRGQSSVKLSFLPQSQEPFSLEVINSKGKKFFLESFEKTKRESELIVSNNDFSTPLSYLEKVSIEPSYFLGWHCRKKDKFFYFYNQYIKEFSKLLDFPYKALEIATERFDNFDANTPQSQRDLAESVDNFILKRKKEYEGMGLPYKPFVFIKYISGTYGLAVVKVHSGEEVLNWNNRIRTKLKASKGRQKVNSVLLQEAVPSAESFDGDTAESVIYAVGSQPVGGFMRTHSEKNPEDNLNSPGAVYKRLCLSDLKVNREGFKVENVYGWLTKVALMSLAREMEDVRP